MAAKFVVLAFLVAAAQGSGTHGGNYNSFSYGVSEPHTGDVKSQHETRQGDNVVGQYSLLESDGTRRIVDYAANPHSGFNAIVRKDPAIVGYSAPVAALPIAQAAPLAYASTPSVSTSAYSTSVAHGGIAAPLTYNAPVAASLAYSSAPAVSSYSTSVAHGDIAQGAYSAPLSYSSPLNLGSYNTAPLSYGGYSASPLAHGSYASPLARSAYSGITYGARHGW